MAAKLDEPIGTISAVLTMRQIVWLSEEAERKGIKRTAVLRDVVERGIESARDSAEEVTDQPVAA